MNTLGMIGKFAGWIARIAQSKGVEGNEIAALGEVAALFQRIGDSGIDDPATRQAAEAYLLKRDLQDAAANDTRT